MWRCSARDFFSAGCRHVFPRAKAAACPARALYATREALDSTMTTTTISHPFLALRHSRQARCEDECRRRHHAAVVLRAAALRRRAPRTHLARCARRTLGAPHGPAAAPYWLGRRSARPTRQRGGRHTRSARNIVPHAGTCTAAACWRARPGAELVHVALRAGRGNCDPCATAHAGYLSCCGAGRGRG